MKTKHQSVRLDDETAAIVRKYKEILQTNSFNETVVRLIHAADGKQFVTRISSSLPRYEDVSFFAGHLEKVKFLFDEIKSRLTVPQPRDQSDKPALNEWRENRARIEKFYDECEVLFKRCYPLSVLLYGITFEDYSNMREAAYLIQVWARKQQKLADASKSQQERTAFLESKRDFDEVLKILKRFGIEPNSD